MKRILLGFLSVVLLISCQKKLTFEEQQFSKKAVLSCKENCTEVSINIPIAINKTVAADSINKRLFKAVEAVISFEKNPIQSVNYDDLTASFVNAYTELKTKFPDEIVGWEGDVKAKVIFQSDKLLNIEINFYTFTGGAHGYQGLVSLLFDAKTGKKMTNNDFFKNEKEFLVFAENKFRAKFKIPAKVNINATGFMFENEVFRLPENIFFTKTGMLLYYNQYEAASYSDGSKDLIFTFDEVKPFLKDGLL